ncbi:MAG: hypothetical protein PVH80_09635 [Anaerolineae bacterium]|jgi:hypothetical protein
MDRIDWTFRLTQALNFLILAGWSGIAPAAMIRLRRRRLDEIARVLWATVIVLLPLVGALASLIVRPGHLRRHRNEGW